MTIQAPTQLDQSTGIGSRPRVWQATIIYTILTLGAITSIVPFLWMLTTSLKAPYKVFAYPPELFPNPIVWRNYIDAVQAVPFGRFYLNSLIVSVSVTALQLLTSSLAGYAFARLRFPGRDQIFLIYLATLMVPFHVTLIPNYILMNQLGWINTYQALILPQAFTAFGTFLLRQHLRSLPLELEDAARIDGASTFDIYWRVMLPLSTSALSALGILTFLGQWNNLFWPLVVTTQGNMRTLPVGLSYFRGQYGTQWNLLMAGTAISLLPVLLIFIAGQRSFVRSLALTGFGGR